MIKKKKRVKVQFNLDPVSFYQDVFLIILSVCRESSTKRTCQENRQQLVSSCMKKIIQIRAEQEETLVFRRVVLTQMSLLQIRLEQSVRVWSSRRIWRQAATPDRLSRPITWERGHNARVSEERKSRSTCHPHSFTLLFDTSRSCSLAGVEGQKIGLKA